MKICWRTVAIVSVCLGLPLIYIGAEGDAAVAKAKCTIGVNYPNVTLPRNGWFGYPASFTCQNHDPNSVSVTFQILRDNRVWRVMHAKTSPLQFTTRCKRGGKPVEFRPRVAVVVKDSASSQWRGFVKTGPPYTWRCLPR